MQKPWNGKMKAVTFSFDDGVSQDKRLIEILNNYHLKSTFNVNSSYLGLAGALDRNNHIVRHDKIPAQQVASVYAGHEIAVHTLTHPTLTEVDDDTIVWQVEEDRKTLERLVGYEIRCMAYPGGGVNNDKRVANVIRTRTKIGFARSTNSTYSFDIPEDLYQYEPSVYYIEKDKMFELGEKFIKLQPDRPQLFYIWGHSYELDAEYLSWEDFENFCKLISGKEDIFYGTNGQVFFG